MSESASTTAMASPEALFAEIRGPLARYLRALGLDVPAAEDIVQEAFLKLHNHLAAGGAQENIRGWLFRVAHNEARNRTARHEVRRATPIDAAIRLADSGAGPEGRLLQKERLRRLQSALASLSDAERQCVFLRSEGLRYREMSEVMGLPVSTVADTVGRAIRKLAEDCGA